MKASQIGPHKATPEKAARGGALDVVVIGGVDPRGGAGLVRDVLTATALGARPVVVGTAWTEQGAGVHRVEARTPANLLDAVRQAIGAGPAAVKVGMVPDAAAAAAIVDGLGAYAGPVVVDPVLASTRGGALFRGAPRELFALCRRATVVTPNLAEAEALGGARVGDLDAVAAAALALGALGLRAVLIKGGHLDGGAEVTDTLAEGTRLRRFTRPRAPGGNVRGTGCALATALAVELGRGRALADAVEAATAWLSAARAAAVEVGGERHLGWAAAPRR